MTAGSAVRSGSDPFAGIHDFFYSPAWYLIRNLAIFFVVVFWLASAYWVYKDARRRIEDPWLLAMATLLGLIPPFLGPLVYLLFRPPEYLDDVRERELEIRMIEERLARPDARCPVCRATVEAEFLICPVCTTRLKTQCQDCSAPLEVLWQLCPFCGTRSDRQPTQPSLPVPCSQTQMKPERAAVRAAAAGPGEGRNWRGRLPSSFSGGRRAQGRLSAEA